MSLRVRFAPSPTGHLHVGNVRTALFNWLLARQAGGTFILRIEDTDADRSEERFERQLVEDMRWLGLDWNEGIEVGGDFGPYRQTDRFDIYRSFASRLLESGQAYRCFCSAEQLEQDRQRQLAAGEPVHYAGHCRNLTPEEAQKRLEAGEPATVRLRIRPGRVAFDDLVFGPIEVDTGTIGDFILLRSDGSAQYNFACVLDDGLMKISHVIRGEGHISNTHRQVLLYEALGWEPPQFAHLSTILGPDGSKLSKRHGATSISEFRELGYLPEALINYLSLLGWSPTASKSEVLSVSDIIEDFDLRRVQVSPATFDPEKLNFINRSHLKNCPPERIVELARPYLLKGGIIEDEAGRRNSEFRIPNSEGQLGESAMDSPDPDAGLESWLRDLVGLLTNYVDRCSDFAAVAQRALEFEPERELETPEVKAILADPNAMLVLTTFRSILAEKGDSIPSPEVYRDVVLATKDRSKIKGKALFHPIRVGLTARESGPELDRLVALIDRGSRLPLPRPLPSAAQRIDRIIELITRGQP